MKPKEPPRHIGTKEISKGPRFSPISLKMGHMAGEEAERRYPVSPAWKMALFRLALARVASSWDPMSCSTTQPHQSVVPWSKAPRPELCCAGTQVKRSVSSVRDTEGGCPKSWALKLRLCHQSSSVTLSGGMPSAQSQDLLPRGTKYRASGNLLRIAWIVGRSRWS